MCMNGHETLGEARLIFFSVQKLRYFLAIQTSWMMHLGHASVLPNTDKLSDCTLWNKS